MIQKLYLCVIVAFHIFVYLDQKNYLPQNKQLINLLYDEMESITSILSWCNGVKFVVSRKDPLALSHEDNHFFITLAENHQQTN